MDSVISGSVPESLGDAVLLLQVLLCPLSPRDQKSRARSKGDPWPEPVPACPQDFSERYVRTGAGQLSGGSVQSFLQDGRLVRAHCNHTVLFDPPVGPQPPRVQHLRARAITASYDPAEQELRFQLRASLDAGDQGSPEDGVGPLSVLGVGEGAEAMSLQ